MSQDVQLQKVVVNGVIVKVGRNDPALHIIGRMLHRRELIDAVSVGKYDDTSRMLPRAAPDPRAPFCDALDLAPALSLLMLFVIILHKAVRSLIRQGADRPRLKRMPLAEEHFRVFVGLCLIVPGEVQVDIRLLVPLKPEECLKRDIKAGLHERFPAHRAVLSRHIKAAAPGERPHLI